MSNQPYASPGVPGTPGIPAKPYMPAVGGSDLAIVFQPLVERAGWVKFIGIWMIVVGALYCLTIFGAIFGVPFIIAGVNLMQAGGLLRLAHNDAGQLREACSKMSASAFITGIVLAISLGLALLYFLFIFAILILGGLSVGMSGQ